MFLDQLLYLFNQSSLRLFEKKTLLTQTQECTVELKDIKTKYVGLEIKRICTVRRLTVGGAERLI